MQRNIRLLRADEDGFAIVVKMLLCYKLD